MLCVRRTPRLGRDLAFRMRAECVSYGDALISNAAPSLSVIAGKLFSIDPGNVCSPKTVSKDRLSEMTSNVATQK